VSLDPWETHGIRGRITDQNKTVRTPKSEQDQNNVAEERKVNRPPWEEITKPEGDRGLGTRTNRLKADRRKKKRRKVTNCLDRLVS
jgi:hypothetical protein